MRLTFSMALLIAIGLPLSLFVGRSATGATLTRAGGTPTCASSPSTLPQITELHAKNLYINFASGANNTSTYTGYKFSNAGASAIARTNVYMRYSNFSTGIICVPVMVALLLPPTEAGSL